MLKTTNFARSLTLVLLSAALGVAACKPTIAGGGDGGEGGVGGDGGSTATGQGGSGGVGGGVGGGVIGTPSAIAEYASMIPTPGTTASSTTATTSSGGPGVDPNTLYVRIGNYGPVCGGSFSYACTPETVWQVSIGLPPAKQAAGGVYPLSDMDLNSFFSETGSNGSPGDCWGGGGSFTEGTLEILSNDGLTIVVRLAGTNGGVADVAIDGDYTAPICQWGLD